MTSTSARTFAIFALIALTSSRDSTCSGQSAAPEVPVTAIVHLKDGQSLMAAIDARSDEQRLVLRFQTDTATLLRRIHWNRVERIRVDGQLLTADEAQVRIGEFVSIEQSAKESKTHAENPTPADASFHDSHAELAPVLIRGDSTVQSVAVDAVAANFDADVPVDGLAVAIALLDRWGNCVAASGTVEVELYGDRRSLLKPQPITRAAQYDRLGRWVVNLADSQFTPAGYVYHLPFEAFDPARTLTIRPQALVNVRVSIPGQGVYEASSSDVRLLPYSPVRNRIEASSGRRYLPSEATGF